MLVSEVGIGWQSSEAMGELFKALYIVNTTQSCFDSIQGINVLHRFCCTSDSLLASEYCTSVSQLHRDGCYRFCRL